MRAYQHQEKRRRSLLTRGGGTPEPRPAAGPITASPSQRTRGAAAVLRTAATLTGAVAALLLAAACSSSPSAPSVASLPGHRTAAGTTGRLTQASADQDMVNFARCMRAHGANIPDPAHQPGHPGLSVEMPVAGPTVPPVVRTALHSCTHFMQPIIQMKLSHMQAASAPRLRALTDYARCMRAHDIPMLDPSADGALNLGNPPGVSGNFGRYTPQFHAADAACRHLLPPGVADNGTGP